MAPEQVRASGTIAFCKWNRIALTSPGDLVFGYPWADSLAHEIAHFLITRHGGTRVPVWLQEGLARSFEGTWRGRSPFALEQREISLLADAARRGRLIAPERMSPSLALLPGQEDVELAFAEVHNLAAVLLAKRPGPGTNLGEAEASARRVVGHFGAGLDEEAAVLAASGETRAALLARWRKGLARLQPSPEGARTQGRRLLYRGQAGTLELLEIRQARHVELGDRLLAFGRPLAATIEYRKALNAGAMETPLLMTRLGRALLALDQVEDALVVAEQALSRQPWHAPLHTLRAQALNRRGRAAQAFAAAEQGLWLNPMDPDLHEQAALALVAMGRAGDAAAIRERLRLIDLPLR
jgi:tetratricopeptide (TPR) repeat protein